MEERWEERIHEWERHVKFGLRRYWYLWPIAFIVALVEDRVLKSTNEWLDNKADMVSGFARWALSSLPSSPVASALLFGLFIVFGLVIHAYFDTRKQTDGKPADIPAREVVPKVVQASNKLQVYSAFYGTGPVDDESVLATIKNNGTDGLVIRVDNNALGCDPAPGQMKRLRVVYSYGNDIRYEAVRDESDKRLILPEDKEHIERTAAEYDRKRLKDLAEQAEMLAKQHAVELRKLTWRLKAFEDARSIDALETEMVIVISRLSEISAVAGDPWNKNLKDLIEHPLSTPLPLDAGDANLRTRIWRFQQDFNQTRMLAETYHIPGTEEFVNCALPNNRTLTEVVQMLKRGRAAVLNHAAKASVDPTSATIS